MHKAIKTSRDPCMENESLEITNQATLLKSDRWCKSICNKQTKNPNLSKRFGE
jgi:hypothetical protein